MRVLPPGMEERAEEWRAALLGLAETLAALRLAEGTVQFDVH